MLLRDRHVTEWQFLAVFALSGGVVDVAAVSETVAGLLAAGGVKELGESAGGGLVDARG